MGEKRAVPISSSELLGGWGREAGEAPLPVVADVRVDFEPDRGISRVDLVVYGAVSAGAAERARRLLLSRTGADLGVRDVRVVAMPADAADEKMPHDLAFDELVVRDLLAAVAYSFHLERLRRSAERSLCYQRRETARVPDDVVQDALLVLRAGKLKWRGSFGKLLRTLSTTIRNLARNERRLAKGKEVCALEESELPPEPTSPDADREAYRALLKDDVAAAHASLPAEQREAVTSCCIEEATAAEFARARGLKPHVARRQLRQAKTRLRQALRSYAPSENGEG